MLLLYFQLWNTDYIFTSFYFHTVKISKVLFSRCANNKRLCRHILYIRCLRYSGTKDNVINKKKLNVFFFDTEYRIFISLLRKHFLSFALKRMKTRSKATHRDLFTRYIINNIGFFNISVNYTHSNTCMLVHGQIMKSSLIVL